MALTIDLVTLLQTITTTARAIPGIRTAFNYDEWVDSPPSMFQKGGALHLTSFPEEGQGWKYTQVGTDLSLYVIQIPMYTVVTTAAQIRRSRQWVAPLLEGYRAAFDTRASILGVGTGNTGSLLYTGGTVVRHIPDWPGYSGFYMLRHQLEAHVKGAVAR